MDMWNTNNMRCAAMYQQVEKQGDMGPSKYKSTTKTDGDMMGYNGGGGEVRVGNN